MAVVPLSATNIRLLSGVPLYSDYKHTRWFNKKSEQTSYFKNRNVVHSMSEANFQRIEGRHFVAVNKHIDDLWNTNYIMFQNKQYTNKWFYGFITKFEYKNKNNTHVHFDIDVIQTWMFDIDFKPSFINREHAKLWHSDGSPVINTVDEGLDYGTEYELRKAEKIEVEKDVLFLVFMTKERKEANPDDETDIALGNDQVYPVTVGAPQPLTYYFMPFIPRDPSNDVTISLSGEVVSQDDNEHMNVLTLIQALSISEDAANNVVSTYITDDIGINYSYEKDENPEADGKIFNFSSERVAVAQMEVTGKDEDGEPENDHIAKFLRLTSMYEFQSKDIYEEDKYADYADVTESKLLMYPYTVLELNDLKGNQVEYKNEYIMDKKIKIEAKGSMGTSNKVAYTVKNYLSKDNTKYSDYTNALINDEPQDVPVVTDMLSAYMQGNRNSIQTQKKQAMWSGITGAAQQGVSGASFGASSMYASRHGGQVWQQFGKMAGALTGVGIGLSAVQGLGDTALAIQSMNAKQQDVDNTPASMDRMGANTNFDYGYGHTGIQLFKKQITKEYRKRLSDFFNMFGYKTLEVKKPNLRTRKNWNYIETESAVIHADINNEDLQEIKDAFDNGITLWHTNKIGDYSLDNGVR